ncbi:MAG: acyltransferase [Propionibacteriaceae bacterium]|nr:acyltransferase [Propionibacteriaceae bacterium]
MAGETVQAASLLQEGAGTSGSVAPSRKTRPNWRPDLQALRALAVALVVIYHLWPSALPGGFIGVDLFFVISGYLMTTHLLNHPPAHWRDITAFWARRIRRLLPVAFLVIAVGLILVLAVYPITQWSSNASAGIAAAIYTENWWLAGNMVDYLARAQSATAFEHFWSLAVEEQFYLIWPLLLAIAWLIGRGTAHWRRVAGGIIALVVGGSLAYCVLTTAVNPTGAYYITWSRLWELAAGGLLALGYPRLAAWLAKRPRLRLIAWTIGLAGVLLAAFLIPARLFPGWVALLPVVSGLLLVGCGAFGPGLRLHRLLAFGPLQRLGDWSYSIYLWHWVLIVSAGWFFDRLIWPTKLAVIAVTIGLSWASKRFVEDRFRRLPEPDPFRKRLGIHHPFRFMVIGMAALSLFGVVISITAVDKSGVFNVYDVPETEQCLGAYMRFNPRCVGRDPHGEQLYMTPSQAAVARSSAYTDGCWWMEHSPTVYPVCHYGVGAGDTPTSPVNPPATDGSIGQADEHPTIALFGNSHAGPYLTPLQSLAEVGEWSIRTYLASSCYPTDTDLAFTGAAARQGCREFTDQAIADMQVSGVDLVIMSALTDPTTDYRLVAGRLDGEALYAAQQAGFQAVIERLQAADLPVLVIKDVPMPPDSVVDCLAGHLANLAACDGPRSARLSRGDPLFDAASALIDQPGDALVPNYRNDPGSASGPTRGVTTLDLTELLCDESTCWDAIGSVIVYFNQGHLSSAFAWTLREPLLSAINHALR